MFGQKTCKIIWFSWNSLGFACFWRSDLLRKKTFISDAFFDKKVDILITKAFKNHIKSYKIIEIHAFLSFWGTIVVHPYLARGTGACPHPSHLQKTQVLAASNHNDLVQLSLLYIPKGFGWRGTAFRKYKTVTEHDDHEQFNKNNSTRFHSRAQGITLQPFPTLTLILNR